MFYENDEIMSEIHEELSHLDLDQILEGNEEDEEDFSTN